MQTSAVLLSYVPWPWVGKPLCGCSGSGAQRAVKTLVFKLKCFISADMLLVKARMPFCHLNGCQGIYEAPMLRTEKRIIVLKGFLFSHNTHFPQKRFIYRRKQGAS